MKTNLLFVSVGILLAMAASAYGETCVTNEGLHLCVDWDGDPNDPELGLDVDVDFGCTGCELAPAVELTTSRTTWRVWSFWGIQSNAPADIGAITTTGSGD
ncbi:MAG: hypothetical protein ACE5E5_10900 [Phycisphaerae bacterium]